MTGKGANPPDATEQPDPVAADGRPPLSVGESHPPDSTVSRKKSFIRRVLKPLGDTIIADDKLGIQAAAGQAVSALGHKGSKGDQPDAEDYRPGEEPAQEGAPPPPDAPTPTSGEAAT